MPQSERVLSLTVDSPVAVIRFAVIEDGTRAAEFERDPELYYQPSTRPGASLPHAWLGRRAPGPSVSTLDAAGKRRFMLFTGHGRFRLFFTYVQFSETDIAGSMLPN